MKFRQNIAVFGTVTILFGCITLYLMTDLTFPQKRDVYQDNKWLHFDDRLKRLEDNLNQHNEQFGKIKNVIEKLKPAEALVDLKINDDFKYDQFNDVSNRSCPLLVQSPHTDIQMLEMYEKLKFDNIDGGAWKQGFRIEYNEQDWNDHHKLKVFIVPHSHNDPGWLKTFEQYFRTRTKHIFDNMMEKLIKRRKFIWAEVSFLKLWWDQIPYEIKTRFKNLVQSGQIEIVTGGWVMNDEANTHWQNMVLQLTEGHQWLQQNLNITPHNGWTIDPFGESPTMAYLLKQAGLNNLVIQRIHYSVKKELALNQQLEFRWRQIWDQHGSTELFTHMMPFYSYDIPHTCGPDPKVCCQFDFLRLPGLGLSCPWGIPPQRITNANVDKRALMLLDQYRQKSKLYKSNVLLIPLGDDFRYDRGTEWDEQFQNYEKLIQYLNRNTHLNAEIQFGTLNDFFTALREERSVYDFPNLSGDFFTYADRDEHYWSGYYTSRPFYKRMDRILLSYLRAAEIITFYAANSGKIGSAWILGSESQVSSYLSQARQKLSLFQHHDGITGTAKDFVVVDYGMKMLKAIYYTQRIIQHGVNVLLSQLPTVPNADTTYYEVDDERTVYNELPRKKIIDVKTGKSQEVVLFNSLTHTRKEVVTFYVTSPYVKVYSSKMEPVQCQVSPTFTDNKFNDYYELAFVANIPPLSLTVYIISSGEFESATIFSKVKLYNYGFDIPNVDGFINNIEVIPNGSDFSIKNDRVTAAFKHNGFLKAIKIGTTTYPVHLDFANYGVTSEHEKSGAYLFLPNGDAQPIPAEANSVKVIEGPIYSSINFEMNLVKHSVRLDNSGGADSLGLEIQNIVDIRPAKNFEMVMRLSTLINSTNEFFTDLNGYQILKRKRFKKLPIQANYYPMPSLAFIEDSKLRLTVLTSGPLGVSSLREGQLEIMQDRQLLHDDNRGLGQGVVDNVPTKHTFRILLEERQPNCYMNIESDPAGYPSLHTHVAAQSLLNPIYSLISTKATATFPDSNFSGLKANLGVDFSVPFLRTSVYAKSKSDNIGLTIHRQNINTCFKNNDYNNFPLSNSGAVNISSLLPDNLRVNLYNSSLSFLNIDKKLDINQNQMICPMEIKSYLLERIFKTMIKIDRL